MGNLFQTVFITHITDDDAMDGMLPFLAQMHSFSRGMKSQHTCWLCR